MQPGDAFPPVAAQAAVSGKPVDASFAQGRRTVVIVHGARNTDAPKAVALAVRGKWADHRDVGLATIVDLRAFGGLWKKVAEAQVKQTYDKLAARARDAGLPPEEHVVIVPDWDGAVGNAFGVAAPDKDPAAIVFGADGKVRGVATGRDLAPQVMALLEKSA